MYSDVFFPPYRMYWIQPSGTGDILRSAPQKHCKKQFFLRNCYRNQSYLMFSNFTFFICESYLSECESSVIFSIFVCNLFFSIKNIFSQKIFIEIVLLKKSDELIHFSSSNIHRSGKQQETEVFHRSLKYYDTCSKTLSNILITQQNIKK